MCVQCHRDYGAIRHPSQCICDQTIAAPATTTYQLQQIQQHLNALRARLKSVSAQPPTSAFPPPLPHTLPAVFHMTIADKYRFATVTRYLEKARHVHPDHLSSTHHTITDSTQRTVTIPPYLLSDSNV